MTRKLTGNLTKRHSIILRAKRAKFQKMRILPPQIVKITSFFVKILRKFSKCKVTLRELDCQHGENNVASQKVIFCPTVQNCRRYAFT